MASFDRVVVVMPTYNEAENLPRMVEELLRLPLPGLQLLVVDDNSPDGTGAIAEGLAGQHPGRVTVMHRAAKLGLGSAYIAGFRWALDHGADAICEMDADFSHPPADLLRLVAGLEAHDVVVGSRYVAGGQVDPGWSRWRKFLSQSGNWYARLVTGLRVQDTTAGFKCFRRQVLESLDLEGIRSNGYAFQIEVAYACQKHGRRVLEVPIAFLERGAGRSKMSRHIVWEAVWRVWQLPWRYRR